MSFMATRPRWLAAVLEGPEGADGAGDVPAGGADASALGPPSAEAIVEVPVVELPEDRAAQAFGRRLASETSGPASALGDPEPTAVQGHASEAARASASLNDAAAVAGGADGAMENVAELPGTPPAAFGALPAPPSAHSLRRHVRALERELDGVHLDAARDRRAHRRLEATVGSLLSELNDARSDVAQLLRRVARLEPAPAGVTTPERSRSPPRR